MAKALCQSFVLIHFSQISYIKSTIFPNKSRNFSRILMKINHYADLDGLYNSGFECEKIESAVRPQIHENGRSARHLFRSIRRFRSFAAKFFWTQKTFDRADQELSNGMHLS